MTQSEQPSNWKSKLRYFPCVGKKPRDRGWQQQATNQSAQVEIWRSEPNVNLGIACGQASDIFVLDIDVKGADGFETLRQLGEQHEPLPRTYTVKTPSGGFHKYFKHPDVPIKNKVKFAPALDTRTDGGLVIAPDSHTEQGKYECTIDVEPAVAPDWLLKVIVENSSDQPRSQATSSQISQGQRNDFLFRLGCSMRQKSFSREAIEAALLAENEKRCKPPLPENEVVGASLILTLLFVGARASAARGRIS